MLEMLGGFATGNTLVLLYLALSFVRMIVKPLYQNGKKISALVESITKALNEGVFSHDELVFELRQLNAILGKK